GGGLLQGAAGSQIEWNLSTSIAVQETFFEVATTRPEPLRRLFIRFPTVRSSVMIASSWSRALDDVSTVFVWPGLTSRNARLPAWTEFRSTPVSSKTSTPMSRGAESTLVGLHAVAGRLVLTTPAG